MSPTELLTFAAIGLMAGLVGGLLGIGGSTVFIPIATLLLGPDQQVYQAAAMILNAAVAASATIRHWRAGALSARRVVPTAVFAIVAVLFGVAAGNAIGGVMLSRLFGGLLLALAIAESRVLLFVKRSTDSTQDRDEPVPREHPALLGAIGVAMGLLGGLLGVGGGTVGVPLLRYAARFPLRICIATAASVTLPLAAVGAIYKNLSLSSLPGESAEAEQLALLIAATVVPTAIAGAFFGATLVHRLPLRAIRIAFVLLLVTAGARMMLSPTGSGTAPSPEGSAIEGHQKSSTEGDQPSAGVSGEAALSEVGPPQSAPSGTTTPKMSNAAVCPASLMASILR
jgi:uncharacterized membrane protein YfcA